MNRGQLRQKTSVFYQNFIKQLPSILDKIFSERKIMVEALPVGRGMAQAAIRVGPSMGPIYGEGPSLGNLSSIGKIAEESDMPTTIKFEPLGQIRFNPEPQTLKQFSIVDEAEKIVTQTLKVPEPTVSVEIKDDVRPKVQHVVSVVAGWAQPKAKFEPPEVESLKQAAAMPDLSQDVVKSKSKPAVFPVPLQQIVEEEEVGTKDMVKETLDINEDHQIEELRVLHVEDEPVSRQRRYDFREAIERAKDENEQNEEIDGRRVTQLLAPETRRSGILEEEDPTRSVPDGSRVETIEEFAARKYQSVNQASEQADQLISENQPVKRAKYGRRVVAETIARVKKFFFNKKSDTEEVVSKVFKNRIIKKKKVEIGVSSFETTEVEDKVVEKRVSDYSPDLAQAFNLALSA